MKIKNFLFIVTTFITVVLSQITLAEDITLFDYHGSPVAYIDIDDQVTVYLWVGKPAAYLEENKGNVSVYGFNGKHLGWFSRGIFWDNKGYVVGFTKGTVPMITKLEPIKGIKEIKPIKSLKYFEPLNPALKTKWSDIPLTILLNFGII